MGGQERPTSDSQMGDGEREQKVVGVDNSTDVGGPEQSEMEKSSVKATSSNNVTVKERVEVPSSSSRPERVKTPTKKAAAKNKPQKSKEKAQKKAIAPGKSEALPEGVTPGTSSEDDALRSETGDEEEATEQEEEGDEEVAGEVEEEGGGEGEQEEEEEEEEKKDEGPFVQAQTGNNVIDVVRRVLSDRTRRYMNREYLTAWEHCDEPTWEPLVHFPNKLPVEQYWGSRGLSWKVELADKRRNGRCGACDEPITYDSVTVNRLMAKGYPYHLDCAFKDSNIRNSIGDYQDLVFFEELERRYRRRVGYNWKLFSASHKAAHHDDEEAEDEDEEKRQKETASVPRKRKRSTEGSQAPLHSKKKKPAARPRRESPSTQSQDDQMDDEMVDVVDSYFDELGSDSGDGIHCQEGHSMSAQREKEVSEYSAARAQSAVERLNASARTRGSIHQASASLVPFNPMVGVSAGIVDMAKPAVSERQPAARPPPRPLPQAVSPAPTFASTEPLTELVITLSERLRDLETRLAQQGLRSPAAEPPSLDSIPTHVLAQELSRRLANPN